MYILLFTFVSLWCVHVIVLYSVVSCCAHCSCAWLFEVCCSVQVLRLFNSSATDSESALHVVVSVELEHISKCLKVSRPEEQYIRQSVVLSHSVSEAQL